MSYFSEKLKDYLNKAGLTPYQLSKMAGIGSPHMYSIINDKRSPTDDVIHLICSVEGFQLDEQLLKMWRAVDEAAEGDAENFKKTVQKLDETPSDPEHDHDQQDASLYFPPGSPLKQIQGQIKAVPIIGMVSAGMFTPAEQVEGGLGVAYHIGDLPSNVICLQVGGDSMEPRFPDGTAVFCLEVRGNKLKNGKEYIVQLENGDTTFKVVQVSDDGLILHPLNPHHRAMLVKKVNVAKAWEVVAHYFGPKMRV